MFRAHGIDGDPGAGDRSMLTMTVIPALAAVFLGRALASGYAHRSLGACRLHPVAAAGPSAAGVTVLIRRRVFGGSVVLATGLGGEFIPQLAEGSWW